MKRNYFFASCALASLACSVQAAAQQTANEDAGAERGDRRLSVDPYIEASQVLVAELSPGDDVVTYTQVAVGGDASLTGRNNGGSVSLRYDRGRGPCGAHAGRWQWGRHAQPAGRRRQRKPHLFRLCRAEPAHERGRC